MDLGPKLGHRLSTEYVAFIEPIVRWAVLTALLVAVIAFCLSQS
jgi:hypothetical protein